MESTSKSKKRKKSGSENRKASKARKEENERLGSFMKSYFTTSTKSSDNTDVYNTDDQAPLDAGENNEAEKNNDKRYEDCEANDENDVGYEIEEVQVTVTGASEIQERVEKDNTNVQECAMSSVPAPIESELASYDSYSFIDNEVNSELNDNGTSHDCVSDYEIEHIVPKERLNTTIETPIVEEDATATRHNTNSANPTFTLDEENETLSYDPAFLVGMKFTINDKKRLCKIKPCQPPESVLSTRKKQFGERHRHCSQEVFFHEDQARRKWLSYSLSKDCLFCLPCLLFSDECLRGGNVRPNQGSAFTNSGFSNWKKQYSAITKHETSESHINAKIAQVVFLQGLSIDSCLEKQEKSEILRRKREIVTNRNVMKRVVDTVLLLGKQGLAFRGHRESLDNPEINRGNYLETLDYLSIYDDTIHDHLERVRNQQALSRNKSGGKRGAKGRGSKLTFLSNDTQNNVINIIGKEITSQIVKEIDICRAWALIADTTPDITQHEQLSICVRIVNRTGQCSEHLLACKRASGTKAMELYNLISETLASKAVSFDKLVAQTYDGASNMSGCYNGLQAIIKEKVGQHVVFVHCYAHTLNLVLSDSAGVSVRVISLFSELEALYLLFSRNQRIHAMFEDAQREDKLKVLTLKRLNTVRWHSREFCLKVFLSRYDCIFNVLDTVSLDTNFDPNQRKTASGLLTQMQMKQFLATAYLFRQIFVATGPLSRYLQSVEIDFGKALGMVESAIGQLGKLREEPEKIIRCMEKQHDSSSVAWQQPRIRRRRRMDDENAEDEPAETPEDDWKRNTFYVAVDAVLNSMRNRFEKNQPLLQAFSLFAPSRFPKLIETFKTAHDLQACLNTFCETYNLDVFRCADELFNFAHSYEKFDSSAILKPDEVHDEDEEMSDEDYDDDDDDDGESDISSDSGSEQSESVSGQKKAEKQTKKNVPRKVHSFYEALSILCHPDYSLVDAYPTLCRVYSIAVAIPVSSSTAERSFSALKRVKTRIRSSMVQERLESLLTMVIERKILLKCDKERLINLYAGHSPELSKALLE